jgi:hypothetical protein
MLRTAYVNIASSILASQPTASGWAHHQFHPRLALEVDGVPENSELADVELHGGRRKGASSGEGRERPQRASRSIGSNQEDMHVGGGAQ